VSLLHFVLALRGFFFLSVSYTNVIIKHVKKFHIHSTNWNLGFPLPWVSNLLSSCIWRHVVW